MPRPYDPNYADWSAVMDQFDIDHATTLIGHSSGAGFLLRYVSENIGKTPQQLILVAPWMDPNRELTDVGFFDFEIDSTITDICDVHVFISRDDGVEMLDTVTLIQRELPKATVHEFTNRGHFCTAEFPELLLNSSLEKVTQTYPLTISYDSLLVYHISSSSASRQEV